MRLFVSEKINIIVQAPMTFRQVLVCYFGTSIRKTLLWHGTLTVNGEYTFLSTPLKVGDEIQITLNPETINPIIEQVKEKLDIEYEDDFLLVINKPAGIPVLPSSYHKISLANYLYYYAANHEKPFSPHYVSRIDTNTQGMIIIAKHGYIHGLLAKQKITKRYYAKLDGIPSHQPKIINLPIGPDPTSIVKQSINFRRGKVAQTKLINFDPINQLANLELITGRTHQIRIHMAALNAPLTNDNMYNPRNELRNYYLQSYYVSFYHPITFKKMIFERESTYEKIGNHKV